MYDPLLHVVLYQPEIPYNTGSVGRTCVAVGAKLWLVRPLGFRVDDYHLRRAGMDYWQHLAWEVVDDWAALINQLPPDAVFWMFTKTATRDYREARFSRNMFSSLDANRKDCRANSSTRAANIVCGFRCVTTPGA